MKTTTLIDRLHETSRSLRAVQGQCRICKGPCDGCGLYDKAERLETKHAELLREFLRRK